MEQIVDGVKNYFSTGSETVEQVYHNNSSKVSVRISDLDVTEKNMFKNMYSNSEKKFLDMKIES